MSSPELIRSYSFYSHPADALRYQVQLNGSENVVVCVPTSPPKSGEYRPTIEDVAAVLSLMPRWVSQFIARVSVEPAADPEVAHYRQQYHDPTLEFYMSAGADGIINIYPSLSLNNQASMYRSMIHEVGHILSYREWGESVDDNRWSLWQGAIQQDIIFVSKYAKYSDQEDFAETFELYCDVRGTAQEGEVRPLLSHRFSILDQLCPRPDPPAQGPVSQKPVI